MSQLGNNREQPSAWGAGAASRLEKQSVLRLSDYETKFATKNHSREICFMSGDESIIRNIKFEFSEVEMYEHWKGAGDVG